MERLFNETRISLSQLASQQDVSVSTVWRWCTRGVRRVCLESLNVGGRRYTTNEAFQRFLAATQTTIAIGDAPAANNASTTSVAHDDADVYLTRQGV